MVKVTLNENLVPSRHPWVNGHPYSDLALNVLLARRLIRIAAFTFQLKQGLAVYSGYVNEYPRGEFKLSVLENGVAVRKASVIGMGFGGEMSIEVEDFSQAIGQDLFEGFAIHPSLELVVYLGEADSSGTGCPSAPPQS